MTSRERVQLILDHKMPDRVAVDIGSTACGLTDRTMKRVKDYFGITSEDIVHRPDESSSLYNDEVVEAMGSDFRHVFLRPRTDWNWEFDSDGYITSEWGILKKRHDGLVDLIDNPLKDAESIEEIEKYPWPDPYAPGRDLGLKERAEYLYYETDYAIAARAVSHGFFEIAWELRSMENLLADMIEDPEFAGALMDKILEIQMGMYEVLLRDTGKYVHMVETADDYGTQRGPIMSPQLFREMILPRRKKLNDFIHTLAPQAKIFHHTCGSVYQLVPMLIESGVQVLDPVQPSAAEMDTYRLQREFGDQLIFEGSIDEQTALVKDLDRVKLEMKMRLESLGRDGGYIMAPTSNFQDDMPLENIVNFGRLARELGQYR